MEYCDILKCCGVTEDPSKVRRTTCLSGQEFIYWADLRLYFRKQGIFNRLINIGQYKVRKAFSFYKSGCSYGNTINAEGALLKAAVTPSQRIRDESHRV